MTGGPDDRLAELGWTAAVAAAFASHEAPGVVPARVAVEHRALYEVYTAAGDAQASLAGRLRHEARHRQDLPAVGDWVVFAPGGKGGNGTIEAVLPRKSLFTRRPPDARGAELQIVAANVDIVFLVTSLNAELNLRRLERYLTVAWESGASPVILLSKSDRSDAADAIAAEVAAVSPGVPVHLTSGKTGQGIEVIREHLSPHLTGALLGSSGVGKSTLINALLGYERQATAEVREDNAKGRHTTTRRELVKLPGGGLLIDTPGMRELQIAEAGHGLLSAFDDIEELAAGCAFSDCRHGPEPGCAVKAAVKYGRLEAERLEGYLKLARDLLNRAQWEDKRAAAEANKRVKVADRALQKRLKEKGQ